MSASVETSSGRFAFRTIPEPTPTPFRASSDRVEEAHPLLAIRGLTKSYGGLDAVAGVDMDLPHGRITGLIGPNGAGKTTLLNVISGVERATSGGVWLNGEAVAALPQHRLASRGLVRTFQISRELGQLSVLENLLLARPRQTGETLTGIFARAGRVRREEEAAIEVARGALLKVNLWRLADEPASALSGGQKKLLEISRALMLSPRLVLLDEPAAGVAPAMEAILIDTIRGLADEGVDFLIIEHDLDVVAALCRHVYVMAAGKILTQGSFAEVSSDSRVVEAYLGVKA
ncbi:ABC transporter ATP-binding protein [Bradyrhizobium sp. Arg237L]|uniref:ABC transporter ATP-binding protein n=1 Tax=Bradyrhizobium sp. Arg237L TaxID=3003352 RepID=UPI00249E3FC1|nr:ABC transporter ATP-binding protein [Bradyrhizobium sp. Arg237L]MDI4239310.1 ABC transporter ATP-binding protein [Bradyrhizobium sp. Arg237L]